MPHLAGVVGHRGYSGAELVASWTAIRKCRPSCWNTGMTRARTPHPWRQRAASPAALPRPSGAEGLALVFLATPPEVSMELAPAMLAAEPRWWISAALSGCGPPRTMPPGTSGPHSNPRCWRKRSMDCRNFAARAFRPPAWSRIPGAIHRRQPGYPAAAGGRGRRPQGRHRVRRQIGRSGAGRKPSSKPASVKSPRTSPPTPSSITGMSPRPAGLRYGRGRVQLYRAIAAARSRHPGDHLLPGGGPGRR